MVRLFVNDADVSEVEIADTPKKRMIGLLKKDVLDGALLLPRTNSIHTLGMKFAIDVAYCDKNSQVIDVVTMMPNRVGRPRLRAKYVVEASAGAFEKWGVEKGVTLASQS